MQSADSPDVEAAFLKGGGELGRLILSFDWGATSLGPIRSWPAQVRIAMSLMLASTVPIVMLWGEDGVMTYNDAYSGFAGLRHPALLGSKVREGWPEVADFNDNVMKVVLGGGTLTYQDQELTLHRNNRAEQVWLNLDYSPVRDDAGRPIGVLCIVVETTEKVRALAHLSRERERMAQMFEQAPGFMAMLSGPRHRFELVNPSFVRLVGHRTVVGKTVAEALPDVVAQGYLQLLDRVYATGEAFNAYGAKYSLQAEPGGETSDKYLDFVYQPVRNAAGEVDGIFVEGVDVTERVLAEIRRDSLVALTDHLGNAADADEVAYAASHTLGEALGVSRVGFGSIDPVAETLHVSRDWCAPGVESLSGVTRLRDYGSFIDSLKRDEFIAIGDVRKDARTSAYAAALEAKAAMSFVNVPVLEHGRLVAVFFVNNAEVRNWSPEELDFIREVGERTWVSSQRVRAEAALRTSERELREANETLEAKVEARTRELMELEAQYRQAQKMEAIGQLTGGIAHDFNNLLHGMNMSTEVLHRKLESGRLDNWQRYIEMTHQGIRRAASLTQRLLAFSRRQTLDPKPTDVRRLVASLEDLIRGTVGPSIDVRVALGRDAGLTKIDAPQLENAILNLCINARDAMQPSGGTLSISVGGTLLDGAEAAGHDLAPGRYTVVAVADTGTGMPPEVQARAFDPFLTTKPQGLGTGLGLSMVYGFVLQSGGQVAIESAEGRGTTVRLLLPVIQGAESSDASRARRGADHGRGNGSGSGSGETVLLVEDDTTIRHLIHEELERMGYRVLTAATGAAGLAVLQSDEPVDLLLTDVGLPGGLNGRQVADAGRVHRPGLAVLFITGYADAAAAVGGGHLPPGMEVISKPFATADLAAKVRQMLRPPA